MSLYRRGGLCEPRYKVVKIIILFPSILLRFIVIIKKPKESSETLSLENLMDRTAVEH